MRAFKGVLTLCGLSLLVFVSQARATTTVSVDGSWWESNSQETRFYVVEGIVEGEIKAGLFLAVGRCKLMKETIKGKFNESHCIKAISPKFSKKFIVYMNYISNFYANYPNAQNISAASIIWCHQDSETPNDAQSCEKLLVSLVAT